MNAAPKIALSQDSDQILNQAIDQINQGFLGGRVTKFDLASWIIQDSLQHLTDSKIESIRKQFFNELFYLETIVKLNRSQGQSKLTPEQIEILRTLAAPETKKLYRAKSKTKDGVKHSSPPGA